jgi:hypothetical protein
LELRIAMASTALAANGETNDRITGSRNMGVPRRNAALEALSLQRSPRFESGPYLPVGKGGPRPDG